MHAASRVMKIVENIWAVGAPPESRWESPAGGAHSTLPDL